MRLLEYRYLVYDMVVLINGKREVWVVVFGYVLPVKGEMKVKDFEAYRAYYCGACKQLHKSYGVVSRFLLNYDLVLLALVADAVGGEQGEVRHEGCFANPLARRCTRHNTSGLRLAADGLMLLSYHRLRDNLADEAAGKRILYTLARPYLSWKYKRAATRQPGIAPVLQAEMERQYALEAAGCADVDEACEPTGRMCEALFAAAGTDDAQRETLGRLGMFAGQIVYLLDAAEDYDEDKAKGRYNVFVNKGLTRKEAIEAAQRRCRMAAGEIAICYTKLDITQYKEILDNIFYLGLPAGIAAAGQKRTGRAPKHGQIESV